MGMGELSYSAGARVAGTTTSECGPAVSSKAEDAPCPAHLLLLLQWCRVQRGTQRRVFWAAFVIITSDQVAPRCSSTVEKMNMLWFPHTMEYSTQCRGIIYHDVQHCGRISKLMHTEARLGREHRVWAHLYKWQEQAKLRSAFRSREGTSSWGGDGGWKGTPGDLGGLGKFYFSIWVLIA